MSIKYLCDECGRSFDTKTKGLLTHTQTAIHYKLNLLVAQSSIEEKQNKMIANEQQEEKKKRKLLQ